MKLERLTEYDKQGIVHYVRCSEFPNKGCYGECGSCGVQIKGKQRLAELEDKIENGTLIELPCKVGEMVYAKDKWVDRIFHGELINITLDRFGFITYLVYDNINQRYFNCQEVYLQNPKQRNDSKN